MYVPPVSVAVRAGRISHSGSPSCPAKYTFTSQTLVVAVMPASVTVAVSS